MFSKQKNPPEERLSEKLKNIAQKSENETVSVGELLIALRGSPYLFLTAILSLIFIPPLPLFWLAPVAGFFIALFGIHLSFGLKPLIPRSFLKMEIPHKVFPAVLKATSKVLKWIEYFSRPRWRLMTKTPFVMNIYGVIILMTALILSPPFPIPFWHFFPALTLLLLSLGLIERDGVFIFLGILCFVLTLVLLSLLILFGHSLIKRFL